VRPAVAAHQHEIQSPVAVEIPPSGVPNRPRDLGQARFPGHVAEGTIERVPVQSRTIARGEQQVEIAVVVNVEEAGLANGRRAGEPGLPGHLPKARRSPSQVPEQVRFPLPIRQQKVGESIVVIVSRDDRRGGRQRVPPPRAGDQAPTLEPIDRSHRT
jgi:hypothetical protein